MSFIELFKTKIKNFWIKIGFYHPDKHRIAYDEKQEEMIRQAIRNIHPEDYSDENLTKD